MKNKIVFFHILNNYSGSPKVLSIVIKELLANGYSIDLFTSNGPGNLSSIDGIRYHKLYYSWHSNKIITALLFFITQVQILILPLIYYCFKRNIVFYINTQFPFCAALSGKLLRKKIIYHIHENYLKPDFIKRFTGFVKNKFSSKEIYVSKYLLSLNNHKKNTYVIYNSLSANFIATAQNFVSTKKKKLQRNILQISSLKRYKGIYQFIQLAKEMKDYSFTLILGASNREVQSFKAKNELPDNMKIYAEQRSLHEFYQKADILLNLTLTNFCVETFGMTILEALTYGLPAIVPPIGGPIELVEDGFNGYRIDSQDIEIIKKSIISLSTDFNLYKKLSRNAIIKSAEFNSKNQISMIMKLLDE